LVKVISQTQTAVATTEKNHESIPSSDRMTVESILNALKNPRRVVVLQLLQKGPCTARTLQDKLRSMGYTHSLTTIQQYLRPLIEAELAGHKNAKYSLTAKGSDITDLVGKTDFLLKFPASSSCLEELSIIAIKNGYRKFEDLANVVDRTLLPRALSRLQKQGLIRSNHPKDRVLFYRVKVRLMGGGSPTERRVFHAVTPDCISVTDLSKAVGINIRRTYKYLARLKKRGLILQRKLPVTYELTQTGNTVTEFIEQVLARIIDGPIKAILTPQIDLEESVIRRSLATIKQYGRKGILQSDLWRRLGLDSRRGSRQVLNLERKGFIERSRELNRGRWTYRLSANKAVATVDTVADIPCVSCEEDYRGICPTHDVNPAVCTKLTSWVIGLDR